MQMNSAWLVMVEKQTKLAVARRTKYLHKDTTLELQEDKKSSQWYVVVAQPLSSSGETKLAVARRTKYLHKDTTLVTE
uniref:Uncharacterized protein n=1 Tax=Oryza punctata TaxID=4537 RepID=A0A0E0LZT3_ORYPU